MSMRAAPAGFNLWAWLLAGVTEVIEIDAYSLAQQARFNDTAAAMSRSLAFLSHIGWVPELIHMSLGWLCACI